MKNKLNIKTSGIPLVDKVWGGLYIGATYFLIGSENSGRNLLALQYAKHCVLNNEVCLFFTELRLSELHILASTLDFDLKYYMNNNLIIIINVVLPKYSNEIKGSNKEDFTLNYLSDIKQVIKEYNCANKIVYTNLTPLVDVKDLYRLEQTFCDVITEIENAGITSLYLLAEPVNTESVNITNLLVDKSAGVIYLEQRFGEKNCGSMIITPNLGHPEGKVRAKYVLKSYQGITINYQNEPVSFNFDNQGNNNINSFDLSNSNQEIKNKRNKYFN